MFRLDVKKNMSIKSKLELIISFFIIILNVLVYMNLLAYFFKFFKCRLFNKIPENRNKIFVIKEIL